MSANHSGESKAVPVTVEDVCRWADAFDAYYAALEVSPSGNIDAEGHDGTWLSRWEAHRSVADICRLVRDQLAAPCGRCGDPASAHEPSRPHQYEASPLGQAGAV